MTATIASAPAACPTISAQPEFFPAPAPAVQGPKPAPLSDQRTYEPTPQGELWIQTHPGQRARFLQEMDSVIPWEALLALLQPFYPNHVIGRPRKHLELILRCHVVGLLYNLAGEGLTDALNDSAAFRRFIRLGQLEPAVPEETTMRKMRYLIEKKDLAQKILDVINDSLLSRGLKFSHGSLMDATIMPASSSTKNQAGERDPEMGSTRKNNNWYHGIKIHAGEDAESDITHTVTVTSASESDLSQADKLMRPDDELGVGDKGYQGFSREGAKFYSPMKRGSVSEGAEAERKAYNRKTSSIRSKVEHGFRVIKCVFGWKKVRYRGLKKNEACFVTLFAFSNLYRNRKFLQAAMAA